MKRLEIAFCGNSICLSRLAASLRQSPLLRIAQVDTSLARALNDLKMLCPDVIITEFVDQSTMNTLQQEHPPLLVIIIEAATDTLAVFADRRLVTMIVTDLA
ncbi:MAG TPA: hypothetical protein VGL27_16285 [Negativicutes bacterium]